MRVLKRSGEYEDVSFDKILNRIKSLSFGEEFAYKSTFSEPPIIAVLSLFSYAAETMIGDEENDIGTTNYYVRLLEKLL